MKSKTQLDAAIGKFSQQSEPEATQEAHVSPLAIPQTQDLYQEQGFKPLSWFKTNPINDMFRKIKTEQHWKDLEADIRKTGFIRNPLLAMPDGTLIAGESRLTVCKKLTGEGVKGLEVLPVKISTRILSEQEQKEQLYLDNLSRYPVDEDTKIVAYAEIMPGYYLSERKPGPQTSTTEPTAKQVAKITGQGERQVKRQKQLAKMASDIAKQEGKTQITPEHVRKARQKKAAERRTKAGGSKVAPAKSPAKSFPVNIGFTMAETEKLLDLISHNPDTQTRKMIERIRNARRAAARKAS